MPAITVQDLTKTFRPSLRRPPVVAVKNISLTVEEGEVYGLIGPNGSGKSTTMKVILGLMKPTAGHTAIFGTDSRQVDSRHEVGFLPENPYFYKYLSGLETIRFYGKLCGLRGASLTSRAEELLDLVGLADAAHRRLGGYSKGMLQRIGLAQALVQDPRLVILDEPTAGVDPAGSRAIRDLILKLKGRGLTVMLCSHLLEQVQEVCDHIGIIHHGELVRQGRLEDLISIDDQCEFVVKDASTQLQQEIAKLVDADPAAALIRSGKPKTTLERLFLETTNTRPPT